MVQQYGLADPARCDQGGARCAHALNRRNPLIQFAEQLNPVGEFVFVDHLFHGPYFYVRHYGIPLLFFRAVCLKTRSIID